MDRIILVKAVTFLYPETFASEPPENRPFQLKKKIGGGKSQKSKGFFWWGAARLAVLGGVATSALCAKMGSSEFKKSLHFGQNSNLVAPRGGFLRGGTQCLPRVFQGGDLRMPCLQHGFCLLRRHSRHAPRCPHRGILVSGIQTIVGFFYLRTQIAVSHRLV